MSTLKYLKLRDVKSPERGTPKSAGIDFFVPNDYPEVRLNPHSSILIPSGLKVRIPEGYALVANNKSSIASKKGLIFGASVIDEDYMEEFYINLINVTKGSVLISPGDKIIQFLVEKQEYTDLQQVETEEELFEGLESERTGGFGSTGDK